MTLIELCYLNSDSLVLANAHLGNAISKMLLPDTMRATLSLCLFAAQLQATHSSHLKQMSTTDTTCVSVSEGTVMAPPVGCRL